MTGPQTDTRQISLPAILRNDEFRTGFADARAGRPARFDEFPGWFYEWGRQFAFAGGKLPERPNRQTTYLLARAFERGDLIDGR